MIALDEKKDKNSNIGRQTPNPNNNKEKSEKKNIFNKKRKLQ